MSLKPFNEHYLFKNNASDSHRLDKQYLLFQKCFDRGPVTLAGSLKKDRVNKVLDVAAGSLAWALDVARSADSSKIQLYACDITPDNFPPTSVTNALSITTFVHDVTRPFPEDMIGQFDVVNMRLLMYALSEDQWKKALNNIYDVLRPGGQLLLLECDITWFTSEEIDLAQNTVGSWLSPFNHMFLKHSELTGYVPNLTKRLPEMLHNCSFSIQEQYIGQFPMGVTGKTCRSLGDASLAGDEDFTAGVAKMITNRISVEALAGNYLNDNDGNLITAESGRIQLIEKFNRNLDKNGVLFQATHIIAVRI
ncbi:hypothetical protein BDZ94DRAFT_1313356 [Collybia nuda]|uniref:Methyltransferase domain-containing protein n=1 Tax=Collybia nuda TaxID=64659 RepID=A0A9P5XXI3_9AGAR|nr:hypothetical protein BDZ94DRAFT_1313356 [Collybia nuda]